MKVSELIARLQLMPRELEVMLPCEAGVDHVMGIGILQVARTERDWSGTPVGNYRMVDETEHRRHGRQGVCGCRQRLGRYAPP